MKVVDIALVSVGTPIRCGLYENGLLIEERISEELTLIALPRIFQPLLSDSSLRIRAIYYANGPGSFSALKLTHIFLHTLSLLHDIELFATSSFYFTDDKYIKAFGMTYFYMNENNDIALTSFMSPPPLARFYMPKTLDTHRFHTRTEPLYILPPVQG